MTSSPSATLQAVPHTAWRRLADPVAVAAAGLAGLVLVARVDPNEAGHYPVCPFLSLTGLFCPGCGTLRALHALTHGDLATGFARNPLTMLTVPFLLVVWLAWAVRELRGRGRATMAPAWLLWCLAAAQVLFWVLRNLPGFTWLAP